MDQIVLKAGENYKALDEYLNSNGICSFFLVSDGAVQYLRIKTYLEALEQRTGIKIVIFHDFQSNPTYDSVIKGVQAFRKSGCRCIVAIGGGSAMDVAKCIRLYSAMEGNGENGDFLRQRIVPDNVRFLAVPTTAGTGAEATRYAVIYYKGEKQSITHERCIPDSVLMDHTVLKTLPLYQKKSTMLDALCHSIESFWSVNSTRESRKYSEDGIKRILDNMDGYMNGDEFAEKQMQEAAYIAGKAINITQTTAGHAMCYKLTSLYGIAHGHGAALCVKELWPWMINVAKKCSDQEAKKDLEIMFQKLSWVFGGETLMDGAVKFQRIVDKLEIDIPIASEQELEMLRDSVNPVRLKNNPIKISAEAMDGLYRKILRKSCG